MELFETIAMVTKGEYVEEVSTIGCAKSIVRENQFEVVETIRQELQQLLVVDIKLQQVVEEMRMIVVKVM